MLASYSGFFVESSSCLTYSCFKQANRWRDARQAPLRPDSRQCCFPMLEKMQRRKRAAQTNQDRHQTPPKQEPNRDPTAKNKTRKRPEPEPRRNRAIRPKPRKHKSEPLGQNKTPLRFGDGAGKPTEIATAKKNRTGGPRRPWLKYGSMSESVSTKH